jgi:hypothetical protein
MHTARRNTFAQRHMTWLLWLVLLLPLAQAVGSWHLVSHLPTNQSNPGDDPQAIHPDDCSLCTSAATLIGGAPLALAPTLPQTLAHFKAPSAARIDTFATPVALAYNSRAPPSPLH